MQIKPIIISSSDDMLDDIEHHFKVVAGPGAGKTRWLSNHIRNVLSNSARLNKCRNIACITYTNVGVETIISRQGDSIDNVEVSTIHSFLYKHVVKPYIFLIKDEFGLDPGKIDGHDELVPSGGFVYQWKKKTNQTKTLTDDTEVIKALCALCWQFNGNEELELKLRDVWRGKAGKYNIKKNSYMTYKEMWWEKSRLHHDDVLFFSHTLLKRYPDVLRVLRGKFPYFYVDEFQDTNPIQTKIIEMLSEKETIVGVIGDKAQSIYGFQGAEVRQFEEFDLPGMKNYQIKNNHRSTEEILTVLNNIRVDITQKSPDGKRGEQPLILICPPLTAYKKVREIACNDNVCTLSYANITSNEMKSEYAGIGKDDLFIKLIIADSTDRGKIISATIKGIEYARQNKFKDAIKEVKKICKFKDEFEKQKTAIKIIHVMLNKYKSYMNGNLYDFYDVLKETGLITMTRINTSRASKVKSFYDDTAYKEIALWVRYNDDDSLHRTVHKSKGDEFESVLLIVKGNRKLSFKEESALSFLLNPDLNNEDHRVYYVALSRAKKNLFINVPELSAQGIEKVESIGFDVLDLREES